MEHRDTAGEKTPMVVHRLEFPISDRKHIGESRMDSGNCVDSGFGFHDGRMEPSFGRGRMLPLNDLALEIHGEELAFSHQSEANPRRHQKEIGIRNAGTDVTKSFD